MGATFLDTGRRVHEAGSHEMNMAVMHILGLLYRETGQPSYRRLMQEVEQDWQKPPAGDYHRLAAQGLEFYQTPRPRWESLHPIIGLAELFRITGDDSYRRALVHWWRSIYRTDIHNSGSFSTDEQAVGNLLRPGAIETCCTVAWLALSVEALRLTGDSRIADALEHATWNAVLGYQHPSGRWCTYDTPMNGKRLASAHSIVFQSRPGTPELNCCSVNGPNGLGLISQWAVLGGTNGLHLNYYGPGTTEVQLADGSHWSFRQMTDYPVTGTVQWAVHPPRATVLPLHWRVPEWSRETKVSVNGVPVEHVPPGAYGTSYRSWLPVRNAPLAPFQLQYPEAHAVLPVEEVPLLWTRAEPGSEYELRIATDADFQNVLLHQTQLEHPEFHWAAPADSGVTYYWQVESRHRGRRAGAVNGPRAFTLDATLPTSRRGVVLRAALAGSPEPQEGRVLVQDLELVVSIEQPNGGCRLSGGRVENGQWTHVAVVKAFTELRLYVNGRSVRQATVPASYQPGPKNVGIGCNPNFSGPEVFQGALAEVVLLREALSGEAVRKLAGSP